MTKTENELLADELEILLDRRADRRIPGARVHDQLTHFVEANRKAILTALRAEQPASPASDWRRAAQAGDRMMEMVPMPIELLVTDADKQAACDLIGNDTYGKPHWTVDTIPEGNRVAQAFAKHRIRSTPTRPSSESDASVELLRRRGLALAIAAGELTVALDGMEKFRQQRCNVLEAMKGFRAALAKLEQGGAGDAE